MPIGLRGVGKTVSLNRFAEIAEHEGLKVAFIEAPESAAFRTLLAIRLRRVLLDLDNGPAKRAITKALGVLRSFTLQIPDGSSIGIGVDALAGQADSGILSEDLTDLLVAAGEAAAERRSGVLLAVDKVQYLSAPELAALITAVHRTTQLNLPVVLVDAGLPQLPGLAGTPSPMPSDCSTFRRSVHCPPSMQRRRWRSRRVRSGSSSQPQRLTSSSESPAAIPTSSRSGAITCGMTLREVQSRKPTSGPLDPVSSTNLTGTSFSSGSTV